jgi:prepilin-type processing-associated H-X9-DG protein
MDTKTGREYESRVEAIAAGVNPLNLVRWLVSGRGNILYGDGHARRTRAKRREIHALRKRHVRSIKRLHANPRDGYLAVSKRIAQARRKTA